MNKWLVLLLALILGAIFLLNQDYSITLGESKPDFYTVVKQGTNPKLNPDWLDYNFIYQDSVLNNTDSSKVIQNKNGMYTLQFSRYDQLLNSVKNKNCTVIVFDILSRSELKIDFINGDLIAK